MGIKGLTTFVANNAHNCLQPHMLYDCGLVIDGNSLSVQLYQNLNRNNSAFGGDYDVYAQSVKRFFSALSKCNITPYVIFDGGYEDKKIITVFKRFRCRIVDASRLNPQNQSSRLVLPIMLKDAFLEVITSVNVPYIFCEYEADHEIAAVARYLKCPVLSYDSDFFVFNVSYVPFPSVVLKPSISKVDDGVNKYVLKCKLYRREFFRRLFKGLDDEILPLFATLLGNDYVKRSVFSKFYHNLKQSKSRKLSEGQCRIIAVIEWLRNESYDSAIEKVLSHYKIAERPRIQKIIDKSCNNYTKTLCVSLRDLGILDDTSLNENDNKQPTYGWAVDILKKGKISPRYYDLLHKSFYIAMPQAEDFTKCDSNLASLSILRLSFDILTGFDRRQISLECRKGLNQRRKIVDYTAYVPDEIIKEWIDKEKPPGLGLFYAFLERTVERSILDEIIKLPNKLQMFILTIIWMMKSFKENNISLQINTAAQIYSLILCFVNVSVIKNKLDSDYTHFELNTKYSNELKEWCDNSKGRRNSVVEGLDGLNENNMNYEDCMIAASKMLKYFDLDVNLQEHPKLYKPQYLHFFAQFQCCLQHLSYLNCLSSEPFGSCIVSKTYNGTFIYNMVANLRKRDNPGAYIYQLLECCPTVLNYVIVIANFLGINDCHPLQHQNKSTSKKRLKKSKVMIERTESESDLSENNNLCDESELHDDINNRFNLLTLV